MGDYVKLLLDDITVGPKVCQEILAVLGKLIGRTRNGQAQEGCGLEEVE
jgi:hypothetical protein